MDDNKKQKAKNKYHKEGGKEEASDYYQLNKETIKGKARNRYQELTEEQKELKRQ